ncbi:crossover junction endodeoxyribonuclease RuvC [Cytobacillus sp. FJAT-54145]|uniref:Crossover junction endodeoxyribonuclease RuvC n=1 Tax=Cytobacillus spartinae TaxID=3299023 RepID=A0ABW6KBL9_9BACI
MTQKKAPKPSPKKRTTPAQLPVRGIAIDPGTTSLGITTFLLEPVTERRGRFTILQTDIFQAKAHHPIEKRLHALYGYFLHLFKKEEVDVVVSEQTFASGNRGYSAIAVREALGVLKVAAVTQEIETIELVSPFDVKYAVTGKQMTSKLHIAEALEEMGIHLPLPAPELVEKGMDHLTDSIAIGIAYAQKFYAQLELFDKKGEVPCCGILKPVPKKNMKTTKTGTRGTPSKRTPGKKSKKDSK